MHFAHLKNYLSKSRQMKTSRVNNNKQPRFKQKLKIKKSIEKVQLNHQVRKRINEKVRLTKNLNHLQKTLEHLRTINKIHAMLTRLRIISSLVPYLLKQVLPLKELHL